jgi:ABC-type glycerol-3-phosphate transport system substrate-binding protein
MKPSFFKSKKAIITLIAGLLFCPALFEMQCYANSDEKLVEGLLDNIVETLSYEDYLDAHKYVSPKEETVIDAKEYTSATEGVKKDADGLYTPEEGSVTFTFDVKTEGFYNIVVEYIPVEGKNNTIERKLYINDEIPFENAKYLKFTRCWENANPVKRDSRDNDVRPSQKEHEQWMKAMLKDSDGYYQEPFSFYFKKGENTLTLESVKEPVKLGKIIIKNEEPSLNYDEYLKKHKDEGAKEVSDALIKIQAEDALYKSDSTLYPVSDRTSSLTEPYSPSKTRLNVIGGANWKTVGQWISWEVDVEETGLYTISFRERQNINTGVTVSRSLYIDDEIPFKEAGECKFLYGNDWNILTLGNEEPYLFYLEKGKHTLKLEVALGSELSKIVNLTDSSISELNKAYRQLLMVIGSAPDTYRDYQLESKTPEALAILKEQYEAMLVLKELSEEYSKGVKSSSSASIDNLVNQLEKMLNSPRTIPKQWSAFKDNIVSLGSWELSMKEQPLEIDYILVASKDTKMPKAEAGFFQKLNHEAKQFLASFKEDYDSIGEVYEGKALDVWILADGTNVTSMTGSGRDQATVIKELVDNYFVAETGIPVNVKLVNKDVLLSATLAGKGPDVALNVAGKEPINYALRNAVVDLSEFEDFDEVSKWFYEDAITQFSFNGGIYALPQTMSFHVMFYRADILKDLGLEVPKTWDEFYEALAVIQKNNMNVGIFPDYTTFAMFLYQHGGTYYSDDSKRSGLDTEEAVAAFKQWSGNYVNYRMPVTFDFANRFRTGEMPLSIGDYTNYNYLSVFAPEIRGLWGFTLVPGYEREDGTLDRSVSAWESASIIMKTSKQKENAWEFLKWWMSAKTQSDYGNEIENVLGVSGRVATANIEALSNLAWASKDYKQLMGELKWVKAIPEIPGSYYTERNIKNAFYTVYNNNEDPRETLQDIVKTINTEIRSKREEFNLPTD